MERLSIEDKTNNQGANSAGRLTALEFNRTRDKINELVDNANMTVYLTQDEYDALVAEDMVIDEVEYNIYE